MNFLTHGKRCHRTPSIHKGCPQRQIRRQIRRRKFHRQRMDIDLLYRTESILIVPITRHMGLTARCEVGIKGQTLVLARAKGQCILAYISEPPSTVVVTLSESPLCYKLGLDYKTKSSICHLQSSISSLILWTENPLHG